MSVPLPCLLFPSQALGSLLHLQTSKCQNVGKVDISKKRSASAFTSVWKFCTLFGQHWLLGQLTHTECLYGHWFFTSLLLAQQSVILDDAA